MVGAVPAAKQRNNALWTATRYELSFQEGDLILWCWFSAGCAGGYHFCRREEPSSGNELLKCADHVAASGVGWSVLPTCALHHRCPAPYRKCCAVRSTVTCQPSACRR